MALTTRLSQDWEFGFPGGQSLFDDAAIDPGEPTSDLVDRFVEVGLDHQIPGIEHFFLIDRADRAETVQ